MDPEEIRGVLRALFDPDDPDHIEDLAESPSPVETVREVVRRKAPRWSDWEIRMLAAILHHPSFRQTRRWSAGLAKTNELIEEALTAVRPASRSLLFIHSLTFLLGLALILTGAGAAFAGRPDGGVLLGGVGFATVVLVFVRGPIEGIQRRVADAIQLEVILTGYARQLGYWELGEGEKELIVQEIRACGDRAAALIRRYIQDRGR